MKPAVKTLKSKSTKQPTAKKISKAPPLHEVWDGYNEVANGNHIRQRIAEIKAAKQ